VLGEVVETSDEHSRETRCSPVCDDIVLVFESRVGTDAASVILITARQDTTRCLRANKLDSSSNLDHSNYLMALNRIDLRIGFGLECGLVVW
jgi:hypothetical protein